MQSLDKTSSGGRPDCLTVEKPASNLAALVKTNAMAEVTATVLRQWQSPDAFAPLAKHGIYPIRQVLFHGPPGNGKTTGSQWLAQKLDVPLYRVRCEQLVQKWLGDTAKNVAELMDWLSKTTSAIVLLDEVEQLFTARRSAETSLGREMSSAMTVYWQYLDRWSGRHLFILATNMRDSLDAALLSRIELQLEFGPPTCEQAREVIAYWTEALHAYGPEDWGPELLASIDEKGPPESFRSLWQAIQRRVSNHVTKQLQ
jgi:ATP-dependent 26S proteasome regulatory subunit